MDAFHDYLPRISMEGAGAILIDAAGQRYDDAVQARIWALAADLRAMPGIAEVVPGMNNLMVVLDPLALDPQDLEAEVLLRWPDLPDEAEAGPLTDIPVIYGGPGGEDLAVLAAEKGMTPVDLVSLHATAIYGVAAVGAMPGFVYLSGLDPVLATPRRANPRMSVPKGSVIIGGQQAGIMPVTAPSGWHILGHTEFPLFDPHRDPPAAFRPGDRIRFVAEAILE
jgi:KipI family sensor histidine kinase inhibitor